MKTARELTAATSPTSDAKDETAPLTSVNDANHPRERGAFGRALRANLLPTLLVWALAASILVGYFGVASARDALNALASFKTRVGWPFTVVASALSGAVVPFLLQGLQSGAHRRVSTGALLFLIPFWGVRGLLIDGFYDVQAQVWGDGPQLATVLAKTACDMLLFAPLLAIPSLSLAFGLVDSDFSLSRFAKEFGRDASGHGWYRRRAWPILQMTWLIWVPALGAIYALPQTLQFLVAAIIQCFYSLLLVVLTGD